MAVTLTDRHVGLEPRLGTKFAAGVVLYTGVDTVRFGDALWAMLISAPWS